MTRRTRAVFHVKSEHAFIDAAQMCPRIAVPDDEHGDCSRANNSRISADVDGMNATFADGNTAAASEVWLSLLHHNDDRAERQVICFVDLLED